MSQFCIHEHTRSGNYYEPPESLCEYENLVEDCDHCPYRYSTEDAVSDEADREYDDYRDSLDF